MNIQPIIIGYLFIYHDMDCPLKICVGQNDLTYILPIII